jgi:hypothetical protein
VTETLAIIRQAISRYLNSLLSSHSSIVAAVEDGGSYSSSRQLSSAVSDKVFECTAEIAMGHSEQAAQDA